MIFTHDYIVRLNTEVFMKAKWILAIGVFTVAAVSFGAIGCSQDSPVAPTAPGNNLVHTVIKDIPLDAKGFEFNLYGDVISYYPDKSLMLFSASSASNRTAAPEKYELFVAGGAVVVLSSNRNTVPFDAKYVVPGTSMTVFGSYSRDGAMVIDRLEIGVAPSDAIIESSPN